MMDEHSCVRRWGVDRHQNYHLAKWVSDSDILEKVVLAAQGKEKNGVVVDLGCGLGHQLAAFAGTASHCIGIDSDAKMLERAIRNEKIRYVHSDVSAYSETGADVVVARNVLHYIPPETISRVAVGALKPGGILILAQAVPPSTKARPWHNHLHDIFRVHHAPGTDDMVSFLHLANFCNIQAQFSFHRMNVTDWLAARVDSEEIRVQALDHHRRLPDFPEYEAEILEQRVVVTVRFAIVSGIRP